MDCAEFHLFTRLPCELRVMIWKFAVRPTGRNYAGIHRLSAIITQNQQYGECGRNYGSDEKYIESYDTALDEGEANQSAYLWDAGLWTACPESREVIMTEMEISRWHQELPNWGYLNCKDAWIPKIIGPKQLGCPLLIPASRVRGGSDREDWQVLVRPLWDVFKLDLKEISAWPFGDWFGFSLHNMTGRMPFKFTTPGCVGLVLDFDSSWHDDWPRYFCDMIFEGKSRGLVAQFLCQAAYKEGDFFVWLVDRRDYGPEEDCHVRRRLRGSPSQVYYDLDEELVEMDMDRHFQYWGSPERFMERMQMYSHDVLSRLSTNLNEDTSGKYLSGVEKHIGVLRPKRLMGSR